MKRLLSCIAATMERKNQVPAQVDESNNENQLTQLGKTNEKDELEDTENQTRHGIENESYVENRPHETEGNESVEQPTNKKNHQSDTGESEISEDSDEPENVERKNEASVLDESNNVNQVNQFEKPNEEDDLEDTENQTRHGIENVADPENRSPETEGNQTVEYSNKSDRIKGGNKASETKEEPMKDNTGNEIVKPSNQDDLNDNTGRDMDHRLEMKNNHLGENTDENHVDPHFEYQGNEENHLSNIEKSEDKKDNYGAENIKRNDGAFKRREELIKDNGATEIMDTMKQNDSDNTNNADNKTDAQFEQQTNEENHQSDTGEREISEDSDESENVERKNEASVVKTEVDQITVTLKPSKQNDFYKNAESNIGVEEG